MGVPLLLLGGAATLVFPVRAARWVSSLVRNPSMVADSVASMEAAMVLASIWIPVAAAPVASAALGSVAPVVADAMLVEVAVAAGSPLVAILLGLSGGWREVDTADCFC